MFLGAIAQGRQTVMEQFNRASVDVQVELEAQAEKNVGGVLIRGHARVAEGAKEDGVEFLPEHLDGAGRERHAVAKIFVGAPIEFDKLDGPLERGAEHFDSFGDDFFADAVAGNDGNARGRAATAQRKLRGTAPLLGLHGKKASFSRRAHRSTHARTRQRASLTSAERPDSVQ